MKTTLKSLVENNIKFVKSKDTQYFKRFQDKQTPKVTAVMCSDSRITSNIFYEDPANNVFVVRNIGNQIKTAEGSVEYGVLHLKTHILLIVGHTGCGAIKASLGDVSKETNGIKKEVGQLINCCSSRPHFKDKEELVKYAKYAEHNVDYQVENAVAKFKDKIAKNELAVVGAMYDFHEIYSKVPGHVFIINVNGEKNTEKIKKMDVLEEIEKEIKDAKVKRMG